MAKAATTSDLQPFTGATKGFAAGVNIRDSLSMLGPDEARRLENGILDEKGGFNKRLGTLSHGTFGAGGDRVISMYTYYRTAAAPQVLIHTTGGILYYTNDPTAQPVVWTQIVSGLSTTAPMSFETFAGNVYFSNGVDLYSKWDGAAITTFSSAPKGAFLRLWKDTMFSTGVPGLPDRVYESAAGDAETWPVASWIDIAKGDGDKTTGLGTDGFTIVVFKQKRHMSITDPVTLANRIVDFEKGCESHFSIIQFESYVYFLSRRGICRYIGDSPSETISFKLDPLFNPDVLNLGALATSWAYIADNRVGWALPELGSNYPTIQIEYYPRLGPLTAFGTRMIGPWGFQRMPAQCFTRWRWQSQEYLFGGAMAANKFYQMLAPVGTDDGATITALLETGAYDFGQPSRDKYIRRVFLLGRGKFLMQLRRNELSAIDKTYTVDLTSSSNTWNPATLWNVGTWGPDSIIKQAKIDTDLYGRAVSFIFTDFETTIGKKLLEVGSHEFSINAGEWGLYSADFEGAVLGVRS